MHQAMTPQVTHKPLTNLITKTLQEIGYKVSLNPRIKGQSGIVHKFDIQALKRNKILLIDTVDDEFQLLALIGKTVDLPSFNIIGVITCNKLNHIVNSSERPKIIIHTDSESLKKELKQI